MPDAFASLVQQHMHVCGSFTTATKLYWRHEAAYTLGSITNNRWLSPRCELLFGEDRFTCRAHHEHTQLERDRALDRHTHGVGENTIHVKYDSFD